MSKSVIAMLGKEAGLAQSHSRNVKMNQPGGNAKAQAHMAGKTGNGQPPYRLGRKVAK